MRGNQNPSQQRLFPNNGHRRGRVQHTGIAVALYVGGALCDGSLKPCRRRFPIVFKVS
ncbi:hypothetical protein HPB50_018205 [Hyalomma asiaticum]|uniref:Uncharacterized protein n=1 Tax=Hyalomma asiaticum TaxID=266040 RepID=A0ACB7TIB9_HYAAI|nr:hypothetical protein HPB50_018205 [Hyalomma asiaticum]